MTLRTITFDDEQWQVVPKIADDAMQRAGGYVNSEWLNDNAPIGETLYAMPMQSVHAAMLAVAPEPPAQQPTRDLLAEARDQVEALDRENHQMRRCVARLMARLTVWLDDDQFNEADGIMYPKFEPPAQQPTDEHTDMLRDLLASYGNSGFSAERAALTAAIEALEPPAQPAVEFDIAIAAGDGTLHGAIDHWQERALTAEAKLAAVQPMTEEQILSEIPGIGWDDTVDEVLPVVRAVEAFHGIGIGKGESDEG